MQHKSCYMPPEWAPHERTFLSWPVQRSCIHPENYAEICLGYAEVIKAIISFEPVTLLVESQTRLNAEALCGQGIHYLEIPHNDAWFRDNGPTFVLNGEQRLGLHWAFNAWGEKYQPYTEDAAAGALTLKAFGIPCKEIPLVLEGGSIHTDGEGTLLTTEQCLLNPNRNPQKSPLEIEGILKEALGIQKILWLKQGLFGDETDGHVDNVACFAKPGTILIQVCNNPSDPNYAITQENLAILLKERDAQNRALEIIQIEQPPARNYQGERLTLSYLNFYLVNGGLILPIFGGDAAETDQAAQDTLQRVFPDRKIVTTDGMKLIKEGGNVHCITQQMPAFSKEVTD